MVRLRPETTLDTIVRPAPDAVLEPNGRSQGDLVLVGAGDPRSTTWPCATSSAQLRARRHPASHRRGRRRRVAVRLAARLVRLDFGYDSDLGGELGALTWGHGRFDSRGPAY